MEDGTEENGEKDHGHEVDGGVKISMLTGIVTIGPTTRLPKNTPSRAAQHSTWSSRCVEAPTRGTWQHNSYVGAVSDERAKRSRERMSRMAGLRTSRQQGRSHQDREIVACATGKAKGASASRGARVVMAQL
jgi:hypothetical protein